MTYGENGSKEELQVIGMVETSYKSKNKSVGGNILMLADKNLKREILMI